MKTKSRLLLAAAFCMTGLAQAQAQTQVQMNAVDEKGIGKALGTVVISQTQYGLAFTPSLKGLPPGLHGFHVHENASCESKEQDGKMVAGLSAGSHFDPAGSKHHSLPWGDGHLGDLPALAVDAAGNANNPVLSPRLKMADVEGRSLLIHIGGDNYADQPEPYGGGGTRIACGVIK